MCDIENGKLNSSVEGRSRARNPTRAFRRVQILPYGPHAVGRGRYLRIVEMGDGTAGADIGIVSRGRPRKVKSPACMGRP